ncbi:hypothetical protein [Xanthomarina sp. GH4-25]|uniref:hypothetical protein n=1 Tax=Xanthomarina sp. GH4-25 TaxID=3349335 RepID=UPI000D6802F3|nr:hypothetical protein DI383_01195 [Flavobacteriaceae bacterium LYZ1037]
MSIQNNDNESNTYSKIKMDKEQFAFHLLERTIDDCTRSIQTIDAAMACLQELNNLLLTYSIWKTKNINKYNKK